ncbi:MAG: ABC transporter ATP-binding protein [bacterium]
MSNDIVVKVETVSKKFCRSLRQMMYYGIKDIARGTMGIHSNSDRLRSGEFWALTDISFELKQGKTLGIIGPNGSGKSTMLRMLNGIFMPDKGRIEIKGKVGALIEIGAGFHPLLTGRENIYINGMILGLTKKEINDKIEEIIAFADIGNFIDSPIKFYSSGMFVRLGFSIAVNVRPEILLIDEVLSVGDLSFQNKCLRKLAELREKANAVVFVSHNLEHVRNLCDKVLILNNGKQIFSGNTDKAIVEYQHLMDQKRLDSLENGRGFELVGHISSGEIIFADSGILDKSRNKTNEISVGDELMVFFELEVKKDIKDIYFSLGIHNEREELCIWHISNESESPGFSHFSKGIYRILARIEKPNLVPGVYTLSFAARNSETKETYERLVKYKKFVIKGNRISRGIVSTDIEWSMLRN